MADDGNNASFAHTINNQFDRLDELLSLLSVFCDVLSGSDETPLLSSLKNGCSDKIVSDLIDCASSVNIPNRVGETPLHLAVHMETNFVIPQKLIWKGANVNAKNLIDGSTPLHSAAEYGGIHAVEEILNHPDLKCDQINDYGETALYVSLKVMRPDMIVSALINHGCNVNIPDEIVGKTPLHIAVERNTNVIAHKLIQEGADINAIDNYGRTPLHSAVDWNNLENVCMLLYYNASVNERTHQWTVFEVALETGRFVPHLIDYIADFNEVYAYGYPSILHLAIIKGREDFVLEFIKRGADVNLLWDEHSLCFTFDQERFSNVFAEIWRRTDIELLLNSKYRRRTFLEKFVRCCLFPDHQFLECFYIIFESPYIGHLIQQYMTFQPDYLLIYNIIRDRNFELSDRLKILYTLLSNGVDVYLNDICCLYDKYGFDESVEMLLMNGCSIKCCNEDFIHMNLVATKICYNNFDIYANFPISYHDITVMSKTNQKTYRQFYRGDRIPLCCRHYDNFDDENFFDYFRRDCLCEIPSLLQLSRDVVRDVIYKTQTRPYSFKVYQAFSQLPVPSVIKDILCLKKPIYVDSVSEKM